MSRVNQGSSTNVDVVVAVLLENSHLPGVLAVVGVAIDMTWISDTTRDPASIPLSTLSNSGSEGISISDGEWSLARNVLDRVLVWVRTLIKAVGLLGLRRLKLVIGRKLVLILTWGSAADVSSWTGTSNVELSLRK